MLIEIEVHTTASGGIDGTITVGSGNLPPNASDGGLIALAEAVVNDHAEYLLGEIFGPPNTVTITNIRMPGLTREILL